MLFRSASGEQAGHGLLLWQPSSGAAAKPLEEDEEGDDELDDEAPGELTFSPAPRPKRRRRSGEFGRRCAGSEPRGPGQAREGAPPNRPPSLLRPPLLVAVSSRDRALLKEKRKRREELFIEQKVRGLQRGRV